MPQTRPPSQLLQELVLADDLAHHMVAQAAIKPWTSGPDAITEVP